MDPVDPQEPYGRRTLPAGHRCRVDDLAYTSVSTWFQDHHGRLPIQCAVALSQYIRAHDCTFAEAFTRLTAADGPIILLNRDASA